MDQHEICIGLLVVAGCEEMPDGRMKIVRLAFDDCGPIGVGMVFKSLESVCSYVKSLTGSHVKAKASVIHRMRKPDIDATTMGLAADFTDMLKGAK
jgi:hypothetical protein